MISTAKTETERSVLPLKITGEAAAYCVLICIALLMRLVDLGNNPLSLDEVRIALPAYHLLTAQAGQVSTGSPLLLAGSVLAMGIAGNGTAVVRFIPALAGSLLVTIPLVFRRPLGRIPVFTASAWLAISPIAVVASRRLGGAGLAILAITVAVAAFTKLESSNKLTKVVTVGFLLAVAFLAEPFVLLVLLILVLAFAFTVFTDPYNTLSLNSVRKVTTELPWLILVGVIAITLLVVGSVFFTAPEAFGGVADGLSRFISGLSTPAPNGMSPVEILLTYEPVLLLLGLVGGWQASQSDNTLNRFFAGWSVASLALLLVYPGGRPEFALWAVVPFAMLLGIVVENIFEWTSLHTPGWVRWAYPVVVVALIIMVLLTLVQHFRNPYFLTIPPNVPADQASTALPANLIFMFLWAFLLIITWATVATTWSQSTAWQGLAAGLLIAGSVFSAGLSYSLAFVRPASPYEVILTNPAQSDLELLVTTGKEVGTFSEGFAYDASIVIQASAESSLGWAFRDFNNVTFAQVVDPTVSASMVVTPAGAADPVLGSNYIGQDFVIGRKWTPAGLSLEDRILWAVYHESQTQTEEERVILWVREDIFRLLRAGGTPAAAP